MCLHIGNTPHHGHYTSIVRNIKDGIWRHYNDADVTVLTKELEKRFFNNATPYICFYESERLQIPAAENEVQNNCSPAGNAGITTLLICFKNFV